MDDRQSVWLGAFRRPVKLIAIGFTALAIAIWFWLVLNRVFAEDSLGMHEMIRPGGRPVVWGMLMSLLGAMVFGSLYLSDTNEAMEGKPEGFFDVVSLVCARIAMILTVAIVIVMFYEVVSRYVFARPTLWANELSLWIAAFVFLLAGQYAMQQRSHIRIYVIYDMMPRWAQKTSDIISVSLIWFFTFAMVWGGYDDAMRRLMRMETFGTAWDPPIPGIVKPAILIIIVLVAIQALSNLISDWNKMPEHHGPDDIDEVEIENIRRALEK